MKLIAQPVVLRSNWLVLLAERDLYTSMRDFGSSNSVSGFVQIKNTSYVSTLPMLFEKERNRFEMSTQGDDTVTWHGVRVSSPCVDISKFSVRVYIAVQGYIYSSGIARDTGSEQKYRMQNYRPQH